MKKRAKSEERTPSFPRFCSIFRPILARKGKGGAYQRERVCVNVCVCVCVCVCGGLSRERGDESDTRKKERFKQTVPFAYFVTVSYRSHTSPSPLPHSPAGSLSSPSPCLTASGDKKRGTRVCAVLALRPFSLAVSSPTPNHPQPRVAQSPRPPTLFFTPPPRTPSDLTSLHFSPLT